MTKSGSSGRHMEFFKMHSLGNDFLVIDAVRQSVALTVEQIQLLGDRHTGVGFDQLLMIEAPTDPSADFWYRIFNADGSEAEQCGNGTRCVTQLAHDLGLIQRQEIRWQSLAGDVLTTSLPDGQVQSRLTVPVTEAAEVPVDVGQTELAEDGLSHVIHADEERVVFLPISMGNPHAVLFCDDVVNADVDGMGSRLTRHSAFPQGANIGFCQIVDEGFMRLRVFERGVGETRACGSGACAAMVAARLRGLVNSRVKVSLPGGKLRIAWPEPSSPVTMTGSANLVYRAEVDLESL